METSGRDKWQTPAKAGTEPGLQACCIFNPKAMLRFAIGLK